jgi:hypothetical protein
MAVNGRINLDVLFHDTDGTTSLKVVGLEGATEYTTGKVAMLTGTAGTAAVSLGLVGTTPTTTYRDAAGQFVSFAVIRRVAFAWSGSSRRVLTDAEYDSFKVASSSAEVCITSFTPSDNINPTISSGTGTGTYTIVLYGT